MVFRVLSPLEALALWMSKAKLLSTFQSLPSVNAANLVSSEMMLSLGVESTVTCMDWWAHDKLVAHRQWGRACLFCVFSDSLPGRLGGERVCVGRRLDFPCVPVMAIFTVESHEVMAE